MTEGIRPLYRKIDISSAKDGLERRVLNRREWLPRLDHPLNQCLLHAHFGSGRDNESIQGGYRS